MVRLKSRGTGTGSVARSTRTASRPHASFQGRDLEADRAIAPSTQQSIARTPRAPSFVGPVTGRADGLPNFAPRTWVGTVADGLVTVGFGTAGVPAGAGLNEPRMVMRRSVVGVTKQVP